MFLRLCFTTIHNSCSKEIQSKQDSSHYMLTLFLLNIKAELIPLCWSALRYHKGNIYVLFSDITFLTTGFSRVSVKYWCSPRMLRPWRYGNTKNLREKLVFFRLLQFLSKNVNLFKRCVSNSEWIVEVWPCVKYYHIVRQFIRSGIINTLVTSSNVQDFFKLILNVKR